MPTFYYTPLQIKKLSSAATTPTRGTKDAPGLDLSAAHAVVVPARGHTIVRTDLIVAVPPGTYGRITPAARSSLCVGIDVITGSIEEEYRGNIGIELANRRADDVFVQKGDRIAQVILEKTTVLSDRERDTKKHSFHDEESEEQSSVVFLHGFDATPDAAGTNHSGYVGVEPANPNWNDFVVGTEDLITQSTSYIRTTTSDEEMDTSKHSH